MINIYNEIKTKGLEGLFTKVSNKLFPEKDLLEKSPELRPLFQEKTGLEIGGPSSIFESLGIAPVYDLAKRVDHCNFGSHTVWEGDINSGDGFRFSSLRTPGSQYIAEASDLSSFVSETYDFVLSSHCIEHLANPLKGLSEWIRVLKFNGILVLALPHKDATFDHQRSVTSLEHLVQDFNKQVDESDLTHLEEILEMHDLSRDPGAGTFENFKERSQRNIENRCLHHHVFDTSLAVEMVHYSGLQILSVNLCLPFHIVIVAKKTRQCDVVDNSMYRAISMPPCWHSPFPSDQLTRTS